MLAVACADAMHCEQQFFLLPDADAMNLFSDFFFCDASRLRFASALELPGLCKRCLSIIIGQAGSFKGQKCSKHIMLNDLSALMKM